MYWVFGVGRVVYIFFGDVGVGFWCFVVGIFDWYFVGYIFCSLVKLLVGLFGVNNGYYWNFYICVLVWVGCYCVVLWLFVNFFWWWKV